MTISPKVIEGTVLSVVPTPPIRLGSIRACRIECSKIYKEMKTGVRNSQDGARLVYTLTCVAKMLEAETFELRLTALEAEHDKD